MTHVLLAVVLITLGLSIINPVNILMQTVYSSISFRATPGGDLVLPEKDVKLANQSGVVQPETVEVCPNGTVFISETNECVSEGQLVPQNPPKEPQQGESDATGEDEEELDLEELLSEATEDEELDLEELLSEGDATEDEDGAGGGDIQEFQPAEESGDIQGPEGGELQRGESNIQDILESQSALEAELQQGQSNIQELERAPVVISGNNVYVTWWTNSTGNDEVMFRVSSDSGQSFSDKINLSNSSGSQSEDVEIDAENGNVFVTWWERNATSNTPVLRISNDNGETFGPTLILAANGSIGTSSSSEEEEG